MRAFLVASTLLMLEEPAFATERETPAEASSSQAEPSPVADPSPAPTGSGDAAPPTEGPPAERVDSRRAGAFVVVGLGVVGLAVGAVTGLMAMGKSNDAKAACPNDGGCANRDAVAASDSARTLGLVSTIGFIAGGIGVAAGVTLYLTAPKAQSTALRFTPGGVSLTGAF